jgi:hypothetical protein
MDAARPMHTVLTSGLMWRIVSNTAMPAKGADRRRNKKCGTEMQQCQQMGEVRPLQVRNACKGCGTLKQDQQHRTCAG